MATSDVPPEARPAASVILLRRGGRHSDAGLEVLMVRRNENARVMPGFWVFPGGSLEPQDGDGESAYRACAVRELQEETGVVLEDPDALIPYSRWITPLEVPARFDTRFYAAMMPGHQTPEPDGEEMVDAAWASPADVLARSESGEATLAFPTIKHLESLARFERAEEALEAAREHEVEPVQPRVVREGDEIRIVLPGEPGYED